MKLALFASLIIALASCGQAEGRAYSQRECKLLALVAGQAAGYRETNQSLVTVLADLRIAADDASKLPAPFVHYAGDWEFLVELVTLSYGSKWSSKQAYNIVFSTCDRNGQSRFVKEI